MTEQKQPQAGDWWQKDDTRVCIVGKKKNGLTVGEMQSGTLIPFLPIHDWQHLPDCDSFEWQPAADLPPVESPDDWVTQDRVPPRHGIDQVQWSDWESSRWINPTCGWYPTEIHGYRDEYDGTVLSVRCRRKNLPPQPQPQPKRVTVRLVCSTETIGVVNWRMHDDPGIAGEAEIKHDGYKFYFEVQQ